MNFVETVTKLTNDLVASYAQVGGINHLDGKNLPSKRAITAITQDLLRLLFPGFFDEKLIHSSEVKVETAALLDSVLGKLEDEIRKSLEYHPPEDLPKKDITEAAHKLTVDFLGRLPRIREILQTDVEAAFDGDPAALSKEEIHRFLSVRRGHRGAAAGARVVSERCRADPAHHDRMGALAHGHGNCIRARRSARIFLWTIAPARSLARRPSSAIM